MSRPSDEKLSEMIIAQLERVGGAALTVRKLLDGLDIDREQRRRVRRLVRSLMRAGRVVSPSKGQYGLAPTGPRRIAGEPGTRSGRRLAGVLLHKGRQTVMIPDGDDQPGPIVLDRRSNKDVKPGTIVVARLADHSSPGRPWGKLVEVLGRPGLLSTELPRLLVKHGLEEGFPAAVEAEADQAALTSDQAGDGPPRRDLRQVPLVTIDPPDAKDFDDAVFASRQASGFRLLVAIADVSALVTPGSALDAEALRRGCSVYLPGRVFPMLPARLSEDLCSLAPDRDRPAMTVEMEIDRNGRVRSARVDRSLIRSAGRFSYGQVQQILDGEDGARFRDMQACAGALMSRMSARGALDLDLPELHINLDADGQPGEIMPGERFFAHRMIEAFMVAANEAVAGFFERAEIPTVYRVHPPPDAGKIATFGKVAESLGSPAALSGSPSTAALNAFLGSVAVRPLRDVFGQLLLRSLMQASYSVDCDGHYGLASQAYLHFTSPIRRYPDLAVHRQLGACIDRAGGTGLSLGERPRDLANRPGLMSEDGARLVADACSRSERLALAAERDAADLYRAAFMQQRIGRVYRGSVTAVADFGVFVKIQPHGIEGLVHISRMQDDYYRYDEQTMTLTGKHTGRKLSLAMPVNVRVEAARLYPPQVDFVFED